MLLLQITGSVDIKFDDVEELLAHPMAGMLQASAKQMFEGAKGQTIEASLARKVLADKIVPKPEDYEGSTYNEDKVKETKLALSIFDTAFDLFNGMDDEVEVTICLPDYATTINASIRSPGAGKTAYLLANHQLVEKIERMSYQFEGEKSEYIENYVEE
jgi:hypothetical protein